MKMQMYFLLLVVVLPKKAKRCLYKHISIAAVLNGETFQWQISLAEA